MLRDQILDTITVAGDKYDVCLGDIEHPVVVWRGTQPVARFLREYLATETPAPVWDSAFLLSVRRQDPPPTWEIRSRAILAYRTYANAHRSGAGV